MLALALAGYWFAEQRGSFGLWTLTGLAFGLGFLFRPLETVFFSAPLLAWAAVQSIRKAPGYSRALPALVLGGLVPVLLMLAHAYAVTGNPFVPPRLDDPAATPQDLVSNALWFRFGANMAYNTFMLAIWFLGPLGILLFTAGVMTDRFTRLLGLGVFTGLCLTHDLPGLEPRVRAQFPDRRFYRLQLLTGPPFGVILPLAGNPGPVLPYGAPAGG